VSPSDLGFLIADIINDLALLPLQYLWLFGKDSPYVGSRWDGERFALAFPNMEHLRICGYYFTFEDLKFIAMHMPRLGQLSARVQLNAEWPSKDKLSSLMPIPSPSQLYFHLQLEISHIIQGVETVIDTGDRLPEEVERLALGLHILWPKGVINTVLEGLYKASEHHAMGADPHLRKRLPDDLPADEDIQDRARPPGKTLLAFNELSAEPTFHSSSYHCIMVRVFRIPELLSLVCEQARRSDLVRLLTTSRLFFNCAVPVVWRVLPESAPMILMRLLPGADIYLENHLDAALVESMQPLDGQSLTRFNFYAPHIKQVARHQRNRQADVIWDGLLRLVDTRPILPQLKVLKFSLSMSRFITQGPIGYISAHLCPTLVEIDLTRKADADMGPQNLCDLVSTIALQCPRIRSLKLNNIVLFDLPFNTDGMASSLIRLHDLRVLGLGPIALDPKVMIALGALPRLEALIFYDTYYIPKLEGPLKPNNSLPGSFPSLRHFGIKTGFYPERVTRVWHLSALVRGLTSVSVCIASPMTHAELCGFVRVICQCSPLITAFSLDCNGPSRYLRLLVADTIDDLALLPLRYLWLWTKDIEFPYVSSRWDGERFALAFPKMKHLRIRGFYLTFNDIKFIAMHMPQLRQLSVKVQLNGEWPSKDDLSSLVLIPSPSQLYFRLQFASSHIEGIETVIDTGDRLPEAIERIALVLHALWPKGVICEPQRQLDEDGKPSYTSQINTALRALYEASGSNAMGVNPHPRKRVPKWFGWV
ncbi:unnamed protein product, partial [Rhizoctonia solani]